MASNAGKRLELLKKQLAELQAKDKGFHFVVIQPGETEEQILARGNYNEGDDIQFIHIPWKVNPLKGTAYIPEGSLDDPLADPLTRKGIKLEDGYEIGVGGVGGEGRGLRASASNPRLDPLPTHEQQERWRRHEQQIERDGQRYKGPTS
jgi:hypothetical protein